MNQTLFSASVTNEDRPRLSVGFTPGSGFRIKGSLETLETPFRLEDTQQCRISLGDKTIDLEQAKSLASDHDYETFFELKKDSQNTNTYEYKDCKLPAISHIKKDLSHVTLKVRNTKLIVGFKPAAAVAPPPSASAAQAPGGVNAPVQPLGGYKKKILGSPAPAPVAQAPVNVPPAGSYIKRKLGPVPPASDPAAQAPAPGQFPDPFAAILATQVVAKKPVRIMRPAPPLSGNLIDKDGNFKEDCGLDGDIEKGIYKTYIKDSTAKDNDLTKEAYGKLRAKEQAFEALEERKRQADAHHAVDGKVILNAMVEHLGDDFTSYCEFIRLIARNGQNLQQWSATAPSNADTYRRFLEAEKAYIRKGN